MTVSLGYESTLKSSSFIGKSPNLLYNITVNLDCFQEENCKKFEFLLQIHTPVVGYTRILYVYSCLNCNAFKVFRQIKKSGKQMTKKESKIYLEFEDLVCEQSEQKVINGNLQEISFEKQVWVGEKYENSLKLLKEFKHFQKFIINHPSQIIRYEWYGTPLFYSQENLQNLKGNYCKNCSSFRHFEFQLMPNLNSFIKHDKDLNQLLKGKEWITVLVFTCSKDCDLSEEITTEELVITQYD